MFIKYLIMTGCAYGIDLGVYTLLLLICPSINLIAASITGKCISSVFSLLAHRLFTFRHHALQGQLSRQAWRYLLLVIINIPLSATFFACTLVFIRNPFVAKITADLCCVFFSYTLSKYKIFTEIQ